ncbi:Hpt domain-containing protein [Belnapia sp. T6]|uniref:Hpt domain-containing protein n=1 Tax=Belnapia mucosa TaxID=2804532 RepID=A0ABS1UXF4_9PROT|nr:Hpt domain-containing protein [Belnapia mucosa]MBL6454136.1 Hpt domain-containing protein [Belnapia mucosa]
MASPPPRPDGAPAGAYLADRHGPALAALCADELRERHPRIEAAAAAGDLDALKAEAHALRGVAANFGLEVLAEELLTLERAARAADTLGLRGALSRLPAEVAEAMVALGAKPDR